LAALSEIEKLEARWAENPDGRYFAPLADAYRKAGRVDEAITVVTGGLAKHPDYLSAHIVLGRCHLERKDDAAAGAAFDRVLGLDSENIIALKSLAEIAERTGETEAARRWLMRLLIVDQMNSEAADDLARLGGPIPDEGAAPELVAEESTHISFADLAVPEEAAQAPAAEAEAAEPSTARTMPAPAIDIPVVPRTLERPAVRFPFQTPEPAPPVEAAEPAPVEAIEPAPAAMLDLEPSSFVPPPADAMPATAAGLEPVDDALAWGASERTVSEPVTEAVHSHEPLAPAIEFMGADPNMSTLPMDSVPAPPDWSKPAAETGGESGGSARTVEVEPVMLPPMAADIVPPPLPPAPEPVMAATAELPPQPGNAEPEPAESATDLPLIMPEDVTPAEEMRRPSAKQLHMVSPDSEVPESESPAAPLVTETMGDLYLQQGLREQAAAVYRQLLVQRPGDAVVRAKLAAIESPPAMSAAALGAEAVGPWLQRIARAQLPGSVALPAPPSPEAGPTPMEQAFDTPESGPAVPDAPPEPVPAVVDEAPAGNPARPATDQFSLDQIFGSGGQGAAAAPSPPPAPHAMGSSFDDFFGSAPQTETVRPKEGATGGRQSEDDLSAFNTWLHGLKR